MFANKLYHRIICWWGIFFKGVKKLLQSLHQHRNENRWNQKNKLRVSYIHFLSKTFFIIEWTQPIRCQCSLSLPPENIRKPYVFRGQRKGALGANGLNVFLFLCDEISCTNFSSHECLQAIKYLLIEKQKQLSKDVQQDCILTKRELQQRCFP